MQPSRKRILIAENDPDMLFILHTALSQAGYFVESSKGSSIVEARHQWPDLFIVDRDLPTIDGLAVCKYLRVQKETKKIPIIMVSAYSIKNKARQAGANEFIEKPFELNTLLQTVDKYINKREVDPSLN